MSLISAAPQTYAFTHGLIKSCVSASINDGANMDEFSVPCQSPELVTRYWRHVTNMHPIHLQHDASQQGVESPMKHGVF